MSGTKLRVTFEDGEPTQARYGRGYFGDPSSLAAIDGERAVVIFDNAGSVNFPRELRRLPFIEEVEHNAE